MRVFLKQQLGRLFHRVKFPECKVRDNHHIRKWTTIYSLFYICRNLGNVKEKDFYLSSRPLTEEIRLF